MRCINTNSPRQIFHRDLTCICARCVTVLLKKLTSSSVSCVTQYQIASKPMTLYTMHDVERCLKEAYEIDCRMPAVRSGRYSPRWATVPRMEKTSRRWKSAPRQGGPTGDDEDKWATHMRWLHWLHPHDRTILWRIISGQKQNGIAKEFGISPKKITLWKQRALQTVADHLNRGDVPECANKREWNGSSVEDRVEACYTKIAQEIGGKFLLNCSHDLRARTQEGPQKSNLYPLCIFCTNADVVHF